MLRRLAVVVETMPRARKPTAGSRFIFFRRAQDLINCAEGWGWRLVRPVGGPPSAATATSDAATACVVGSAPSLSITVFLDVALGAGCTFIGKSPIEVV